jgi:hypothetical protein
LGVEKRLRKGISEMLAMVLGIAITIAIGVALFTMLPNYITSMSQQQRIAVTSLSANKVNSTAIMLVLTIKNLGSKDVSDAALSITINGTQTVTNTFTGLSLAPGQERALSQVVRIDTTKVKLVQVGMPVTVAVTATYIDKSTAITTATTYVT